MSRNLQVFDGFCVGIVIFRMGRGVFTSDEVGRVTNSSYRETGPYRE
jgi:hypothetical protein